MLETALIWSVPVFACVLMSHALEVSFYFGSVHFTCTFSISCSPEKIVLAFYNNTTLYINYNEVQFYTIWNVIKYPQEKATQQVLVFISQSTQEHHCSRRQFSSTFLLHEDSSHWTGLSHFSGNEVTQPISGNSLPFHFVKVLPSKKVTSVFCLW